VVRHKESTMHIPLKDVPIGIRRRVLQHLESLRESELSEALELSLADTAVPVYRPDREDVAYYEFTLVRAGGQGRTLATCGYAEPARKQRKAGTDAGAEDRAQAQPAGFVVASADRHDFPITHWSLDRLPPSLQVHEPGSDCGCDGKDKADGSAGGERAVVRLYKLDTLSYVAEGKDGEVVGASGQRPALVAGLPHSLEKYAGLVSSSVATPSGRGDDDFRTLPGEHVLEREDAGVPEPKFIEGEIGWAEYRKRYADSFGPLLDALRVQAAGAWEVEDAIDGFGEGIFTGTTHRVGLLGDASVTLRGEGARLVRAELQDNRSGPPTLLLHAAPGSLQQEIDLDVAIKYANGEHERLKFFLVSRDTPTNGRDGKSGHCECEG
jgi:hypothetical protein